MSRPSPSHVPRALNDGLSTSTMTSTVVGRLRSEIVEGLFPPGSKLVIKDLCERYGVSLIPMREALSRLTSSGFVDLPRFHGQVSA